MMKNSGAVIALGFIGFAVALAAIIGSRLSEQTVTMLTGAACGAGLVAPLAILAGLYVGTQRAARDRQPAPPPIVVMTPQQPPAPAPLQTWPSLHPAASGLLMPEPRQYTILGEETVVDGNTTLR
jgi:hypothetical protein